MSNRLQLTRVFEAPRDVIFSWWSQAEKLQQWSGCKEATRCQVEMDFRPGGGFTQRMQIAGAGEFTLRGTYEEIVPNERIIYTVNLGPVVTRVTVVFSDHGAGTKVVLTHDGLPDDFLRKTISQGTTESFEKLDSIVAAEVR
jgi:uncharacterized protein YndB with AHSA1/START domain